MELDNIGYQIKQKFQNLNLIEKIIIINVICFLIPYIFYTFLYLFGYPNISFISWFELSSDLFQIIYKPWTIISYSFFHSGFFHLFWNMLLLLYSGQIFLNLFPDKMLISIYFMGVIFGGIVFIISYNFFPIFSNSSPSMIGSSAGVMAILIFMCRYSPNYQIRIFVFNIKLVYIGFFFVISDFIQIPYGNAGGHLAHLGGSALGYFYAQRIKKGNNIGDSFSLLIDLIQGIFNKRKQKRVFKSNDYIKSKKNRIELEQDKIDAILDKISSSGYDSLSQAEKDFLFKSGKN